MAEEKKYKWLPAAFIIVVVMVSAISVIGAMAVSRRRSFIQGEADATVIKVSGKLAGRVDSLFVGEGDMVRRGDTLLRIRSGVVEAQYRGAEALRSAACEQSRKVDAGTRREVVASAGQMWQMAGSELELAHATYVRMAALYADSVISAQRYDEARAKYRSALAAERAAHEQYLLAVAGAQTEDRASARDIAAAAAEAVCEVGDVLADAFLTAPADGEIGSVFVNSGELVAPGETLMTVVETDDTYVVVNVRETLLPKFRMGSVFVGNVPALDVGGAHFRVYYVNPLGEYATWKSTKQTAGYDMRTFEVKARPVVELSGLRPGMSVLIEL